MVYTKEQLKEMSDHDINLASAIKWFDGFKETVDIYGNTIFNTEYVEVYIQFKNSTDRSVFEPCASWNDVMPIYEKYDLSLYKLDKRVWVCSDGALAYPEIDASNENPRRAICEVFLMMDI